MVAGDPPPRPQYLTLSRLCGVLYLYLCKQQTT